MPFCQRHQPLRFRIRQRFEQYGIKHAEDGGVGPDAERECEHRHGGEAGVLEKLAEGELHGEL
jgi:hypothetical protein